MSVTLSELRDSLVNVGYNERMMHKVPESEVVDRFVFIPNLCKNRTVLHVGASGVQHVLIQKAAKKVYGLDLHPEHQDTVEFNLDAIGKELPRFPGIEIVVIGEILEHLGNPLHLLDRLVQTYPKAKFIISAPNAFTAIGAMHNRHGIENVNKDHVAYYSYHTLSELLRRANFNVVFHAWYNGEPFTAEGLIFVCGVNSNG